MAKLDPALLGARIRVELDRRGWTQTELAQRSGVSQAYISQVESGRRKRVSYEVLEALAQALGITVADLAPPADGTLPGLEAMPASFARVVDRHGKKLSPRQWELAASFFEWLAAQGPEEPAAYGYKAPEGANGQDDQKVVEHETGS